MQSEQSFMQAPADILRPVLLSMDPKAIAADIDHAYIYVLPPEIPLGDRDGSPFASQLQIFENGIALAPAHARHDEIRSIGQGRFSHWRNQVFFSTSDNTCAKRNGRLYQMLIPATMFAGKDDVASALALLPQQRLSAMERFGLARAVYRRIWKNSPLPDHGRHIDCDKAFAQEFGRLCPENDVTFERKYNLNEMFQLVLQVAGDVAECGTHKGASAFFLARHIKLHGLDKRLCLFDSFEGLSSPGPNDGDYWHAGAMPSTIEDVKNVLAPLGDLPFVEVYQGWIPHRFADVADRTFCFVHIDVDLYQPTHDSMAFFYPRMEQGGIILLDDYGFQSCPGVTAAIDGYMADKAEPIINLTCGGAFIMKAA
jgi:Macrocin-O-methyltransferase (TylF)